MNISYNWLIDLIDIDLSADETARALTRVGLAVEGIEPHGDDLILDIDLTRIGRIASRILALPANSV